MNKYPPGYRKLFILTSPKAKGYINKQTECRYKKNVHTYKFILGILSTKRIRETNTFPYLSNLICPTPVISLNSSSVTGFLSTISASDWSLNII